jgi:DNA polymerase-3 subunit epsilon
MGASTWAKQLYARDFLVLDVETTGMGSRDEVVQMALVDKAGIVLLNSLVRPCAAPITREALGIHHITSAMVADAPTMGFFAETIRGLFYGRAVIAYNADFDARLLRQSLAANGLKPEDVIGKADFIDLMNPYARYWGARGRRGGYRWQSLDDACAQQRIKVAADGHSALGDCLRTLALLKVMAGENNGRG